MWQSSEKSPQSRAKVWVHLFLFTAAGLVLSLATTLRVWTRPREVVRIGCDGIPQVVTLDNAAYSEPNEREIRAFATEFSVAWDLVLDLGGQPPPTPSGQRYQQLDQATGHREPFETGH